MTHNHFSLLLSITCLGFLTSNRLLGSEFTQSRIFPSVVAQAPPSSILLESRYDRLMREGYEATNQRDYPTALQKFQEALTERPNDAYAQQAVSNIQSYLDRPPTVDGDRWLWGKLGLMAIALGGVGLIIFWWRSSSTIVESGNPALHTPLDSPSVSNAPPYGSTEPPTAYRRPPRANPKTPRAEEPPDASSGSQNRLPNLDLVDELIKDLQALNAKIRHRAIRELTQRGDSRAVKPLVERIIHGNSLERGLVLEALTQISMRSLQPINQALTTAIQDESAQVRTNAIRELSQVYDLMSQVNQLLSHATEDSNAEVQEIARRALNQMTLNQLLFNAEP